MKKSEIKRKDQIIELIEDYEQHRILTKQAFADDLMALPLNLPTWEEAIDGITDSRFTSERMPVSYNPYDVRAGARIMYDRIYSMIIKRNGG